ncbi:MAG: hypothetical protein Edafosvirus1_20 [Edafosvirus sp.]|uniref:Uncharacterized protein n=1 Tax=Edafosvirus sp. TaxID=2487765 RepID=A0A3G4ZW74_9VIRU|nr:MAG: hypothetical protein Edafosvirus1_20 [Edafosvirus sp.]
MKYLLPILVFISIVVATYGSENVERQYKISELINNEGDEIFDWFLQYACDHYDRDYFRKYIGLITSRKDYEQTFNSIDKKWTLFKMFDMKSNILFDYYNGVHVDHSYFSTFEPFHMFVNYVGLKYECFITEKSQFEYNKMFTCKYKEYNLYFKDSDPQLVFDKFGSALRGDAYDHHVCHSITRTNKCNNDENNYSLVDVNGLNCCVQYSEIYGYITPYSTFLKRSNGKYTNNN